MRKPNAIVVGTIGLSALLLGVELSALHRTKSRAAADLAYDPPREAEPQHPSPRPRAAPASEVSSEAHPAAKPARAAAPELAVAPGPTRDGGADAAPGAVERRQRLLAEHNRQLMREADERAFDKLKVPNEARAAIRRINEDYARATAGIQDTTLVDASAEAAAASPPASLSAQQTRHADIAGVLGAEVAQFYSLERKEKKLLRNQHRAEWLRDF
jgi:hypothetical protein